MRPADGEEASTRIAVIGMSGRFSGVEDLDQFWSNLVEGLESLRTFSREELLAWGHDPAIVDDPAYVSRYGVMEEAEWFDAGFFGYSPRDALIIDPQQRVFLESAWAALESAGYDARRYRGMIGVYAGAKTHDYLSILHAQRDRIPAIDDHQLALANDLGGLATRVSYKLGLTGPSMTVLTTCSTSLVAIHQACQSLLSGECDIALAGGVRIRIPRGGYLYREGGVYSPDGRCRAFDADARGSAGGEGVGVVVLRRLSDAIEDGDHVRAVVRGSAVNNDGAARLGFAAPSVEGQASVIRLAQLAAEVEPETITYVETHGTATPVGDPVEIAGLTRAFRSRTDERLRGWCAIGSVKGNIGHADAAAGVAGFIKVVLCLEHALLPPSLHFHRPNPEIDFERSPFRVNTELRRWDTDRLPRRAGVSSFGMGGTNAHAILEEAPPPPPPAPALPCQLLVLSAMSRGALGAQATRLAHHLGEHPEQPLSDVAYTLQVGRREMTHRCFVVCQGAEDAIRVLAGHYPERLIGSAQEPRQRSVVFMFPGQGAPYAGMAAELYRLVASFRTEVDRCCDRLEGLLGLDLRTLLYPPEGQAAGTRLEQTAIAQPALFVVEHALARLWMRWGVAPAAMIGHSVGELVAATVAGVFSLEDALALVVERGRLMQECPPGAMLAVGLRPSEMERLLPSGTSIAAVNGPERCVVSGPATAVDALFGRLAERGVAATRLHTSHAFHSPMMESALAGFERAVRRVRRRPPVIPYASNVTGSWAGAEATDPAYWASQIRQPVRFAEGLAMVAADHVLLEVGPGQTLAALAREHPVSSRCGPVVSTLPPVAGGASDLASALAAVGRLWLSGQPISWPNLHEHHRRRVPLPTYPFERQRYLVDTSPLRPAKAPPGGSPEPAQRLARPAYPRPEAGRPYVTPRGEIERSLVVLFSEALGIDEVGAEDNFFDLGGDSLVATQLIVRIRETFPVEVPLQAVFQFQTVVRLGEAIDELLAVRDAGSSTDDEIGRRL